MKRILLLVMVLALLLPLLLPLGAGASNFYIFPHSNSRRLTEAELWKWQFDALSYANNEIFARYGKPFTPGKNFALYFNSQTWYKVDPNYPGDAYAGLSNIEWYNSELIKSVRQQMIALGTTNPTGKPLPRVMDDRVYTPLTGFYEQYFQANQMLPVYDGPGTHYRRAANGKAVVSTNGRVYIAGWEDGWLMLMYHPTDKSNVRVGFASDRSFRDQIYAPSLSFDYLQTRTTQRVRLLEDPIVTQTPITWLDEGTRVTWLSRFFTNQAGWEYVEVSINGQLARGFLQQGSVDLSNMSSD